MMDLLDENAKIAESDAAALHSKSDATLAYLRVRLSDLVTLRASGVWSARDQNHYVRLAEHEAALLRRA